MAEPEQDCSLAILEGELGCRVVAGGGAGGQQGLDLVEEVEVSEEHLGPAFGDTVKVSVFFRGGLAEYLVRIGAHLSRYFYS